VFETAETIKGAQVAADARGRPPDGAACRGGELEEWFAQAAAGDVPDDGESSRRVLLAAATLPVPDAMMSPPRPRRGSLRVPGVARRRRVRGRVLALMAFVSLVVLAVVTVAVTGSLGSSSTSAPRPEVVTSARAPIDKLGDRVERSLTVTVARRKRANQRRRIALQADRRKANERSARVKRRVLVARHRVVRRARAALHARAFAPPSAGRGASSRARVAPAQTRQRRSVPRRSTCGPFDLC
jgi:hypothetical protein